MTVTCEVCGERDPSIVHIPCCNFAAHQHCLNDGVGVTCPYCDEDVRPMFELEGDQGSCVPDQAHVNVSSVGFQRALRFAWPSGGGKTSDLETCVVCTEPVTDENSIHCRAVLPTFIPRGVPCPIHVVLQVALPTLQPVSVRLRLVSVILSCHPVLWCMIDVDRPPSNRGLNSLVFPSGFPLRPESPVFLCCPRWVHSLMLSRQMVVAWSGLHLHHLNSFEWAAHWLCVGCNRTADTSHIPMTSTVVPSTLAGH